MHGLSRYLLSAILSLALAQPALAEDFEGVVHFKNTRDAATGAEFDYLVKGHRIRIEAEGGAHGKGHVIVDPETKKMIILMPDQKMAMEMSMSEPAAGEGAQVKKAGNLVRTGKTDTILGYPAELIYKAEDGETEIWGVKGLGSFAGVHGMRRPGPGSSDGTPPWMKDLKEQKFFPLRVISKGSDGTEKSRMEATKVEKKTLDASLFTIPADYKKLDREGMMRGMGGQGGARRP